MARAIRSFLYASDGCVGAGEGPWRSSFGSWQDSGADRPTPRGAYPTRSYAAPTRFQSGRVPTRGKNIPEAPGPPGLNTSAPCRATLLPFASFLVASIRLTVSEICSPLGRA